MAAIANQLRLQTAAVAIALAALATATTGCGAKNTSAEADLIEFSSVRDGIHGIYTVSVVTGRVHRLAAHTDLDAVWSPDGRRLVFFHSVGEGTDRLYVMDIDGQNKHRLTRFSGGYGEPAWRPDGKQIAVDGCGGGGGAPRSACAIVVVAPDGRGLRRVGPRGVEGEPVWSPDGGAIAFDGGAMTGRNGIFVLAPKSGRVRRLTAKDDNDPRWSPNGKLIAFSRVTSLPHRDARSDIYVIGADGHGLRRLTKPPLKKSASPAWSPDGKLIAFDSSLGRYDLCGGADGAAAIYVSAPGATRLRRLTPYRPMSGFPAWSADGTRIAYASLTCGEADAPDLNEWPLWVVHADGGRRRRLGADVHTDFDFKWQPQVAPE